MTPAEVIAEVRHAVQDTRSVAYRYSDEMMLGFVRQTLRRMAMIRPDLFSCITEWPLAPNNVVQFCPKESHRLVEIFQVAGANAVTEVTRDMMDLSYPLWVSEPAGVPVNFMRHIRNANAFFVYPRPTACIRVVGEYIQSPPLYEMDEEIRLLPDSHFTVLIDGAVYVAESIDNEHVNSGRAKLYQDMFISQLKGALDSRAVTDAEGGAVSPRERNADPQVIY